MSAYSSPPITPSQDFFIDSYKVSFGLFNQDFDEDIEGSPLQELLEDSVSFEGLNRF